MAEQDDAQKTEDPTQKKLDDAHEKGQVASSQEVRNWFMLAGITLSVALFAGHVTRSLDEQFTGLMTRAHEIAVEPGLLIALSDRLLGDVLMVLALPFVILAAAGIFGNMVQHKPVLTFEKVKPKPEKISLLKGFKRLFSAQTFAEFLKSLFKLVIVSAVALIIIWPERALLVDIISYDFHELLSLVFTLSLRMMIGIVAVMALIAGADFMFQRFQFQKQQRMTKQEVKDEHKQLEGDPTVKARLRQVRAERSRRRMMAQVPEATVVVTNPTHYAVAMKYEGEKMEAPVVVAKGTDKVALRIREAAEEHDVPIVENPPLARALHASVDLDEAIPPEHYKAVAEVIGYVMKLSRRGGGQRKGMAR